MSYYELMVLFSPTLSEQEENDQFRQVEDLLKSQEASIHLVDHWGKRKLAYPIKKQRQGIYDWLYFEMDPSRITEVDRKLKMYESILRFMMLKMEKIQIQNLHREMARRAAAAEAEAAPAATAEPEPFQAAEAETVETPAPAVEPQTAPETEPAVSQTEQDVTETETETAVENREES